MCSLRSGEAVTFLPSARSLVAFVAGIPESSVQDDSHAVEAVLITLGEAWCAGRLALAQELQADQRCGDGSCIWGHRGGMSTNGGCRCAGINERQRRENVDALRRIACLLRDEVRRG